VEKKQTEAYQLFLKLVLDAVLAWLACCELELGLLPRTPLAALAAFAAFAACLFSRKP
jgi:hypothetical protein